MKEPRAPSEMVNITVECKGHPTVQVKKPVAFGKFFMFRRYISRAFEYKTSKNFKIYQGEVLLTFAALNALMEGDRVSINAGFSIPVLLLHWWGNVMKRINDLCHHSRKEIMYRGFLMDSRILVLLLLLLKYAIPSISLRIVYFLAGIMLLLH